MQTLVGKTKSRRLLFLLLSASAFGFGAIASKRSEDGGEKVRVRAIKSPVGCQSNRVY
ncbi:MAG: hypothetical protein ABSD57_01100 [Verrucomicrobiota bacterium]